MGKAELDDNGYVPYMHRHNHLTTEDNRFGETFTVWDINKLFPDGNATNWRRVVGDIEKKRFGVDMANAIPVEKTREVSKKTDYVAQRDEVREYLESMKNEIAKGIKTAGDGFAEESQGLDLKSTVRDKEALVKFYISCRNYYSICLNYIYSIFKQIDNKKHICNLPSSVCFFTYQLANALMHQRCTGRWLSCYESMVCTKNYLLLKQGC